MEKNGKAKETFSNFWQKTSDISKKAAEGAKTLAEQTKKNIHDAQAKKFTPITEEEFNSDSFKIPNIIEIVDDSANRKFITCDGAIGWIEKHEGIDVLHMYYEFVTKSNLQFIPLPQRDNVYCEDIFVSDRFINVNDIFEKATGEKLAELEHIAYSLGAKSCSVEIAEADVSINEKSIKVSTEVDLGVASQSKRAKMQSGKTMSYFQGNNTPKEPQLKWFAHDENIKRLIEMRCSDSNSIKSKILELKGSSYAVISKKVACAVDDVLKVKGNLSIENKATKEHSKILIYEIEF